MSLTSDEAEFLIREVIQQEQDRAQMFLTPFVKVLADIDARKPPRLVMFPDGTVVNKVSNGPLPNYRAPPWLETLVIFNPELLVCLKRYQASKAQTGDAGEDMTHER
jgi:hypothetical protein